MIALRSHGLLTFDDMSVKVGDDSCKERHKLGFGLVHMQRIIVKFLDGY